MFSGFCSCFPTQSSPSTLCLHVSCQSFRISVRRRTRASLRIIPHHLAARRVSLNPIIYARKSPTRRVQCDRAIPEDGIRKSLIKIDGVSLAFAICQNQRLRDELVESVRRILRLGDGEKIRVDGFFDHAGAGNGVGQDDVFDLGDVLRGRGGDLLIGTIVGDEGSDEDGGATETADEGYKLSGVSASHHPRHQMWSVRTRY